MVEIATGTVPASQSREAIVRLFVEQYGPDCVEIEGFEDIVRQVVRDGWTDEHPCFELGSSDAARVFGRAILDFITVLDGAVPASYADNMTSYARICGVSLPA